MFLGLPEKLGSGRSEQWGDNLRFSDERDLRANRILEAPYIIGSWDIYDLQRKNCEVQNIGGFHLFALAIWGLSNVLL